MSEEKSNLDEREEEDIFDETDTSNDSEGDAPEADSSEVALSEYNQRTGKSFKSWDDVVKSTKEADKLFARGEHKTKDVPVQTNDDLVEMFYEQNPQAELVKDKLEKFAQIHGSVIKAWRNEPILKEMASKIAEEKKQVEDNKSKIEKPSAGVSSQKINLAKVKPEDAVKLTAEQKIEWVRIQASREAQD
jgi:hypothetical protein